MRIHAVPEPPRALVDALYDTALDPSRWSSALESVTRWIGCATTSLQVRDLARDGDGEFRAFGYELKELEHYATHLWHSDPHLEHVRDLPVGEVQLSREVVPDAQLRRTAYYGEFCEPQRLHDLQGVVMLRNANWAVSLANHGGVGQSFDADSGARLIAIAPTVMRALSLAFDFTPRPLFAQPEDLSLCVVAMSVDADLRLLDLPDATLRAFLERTDCPLDARAGELSAKNKTAHQALKRIVTAAKHGGTRGVRLGNYQAIAVPSARRSAFERSPCIRVVISWPGEEKQAPDNLATLPTGLRAVAERMAAGLSDKEIAIELNLTHATARTYATRVLRMLGLSSRRDLMRMRF